ncbi:MAG: hypothetical protein WA989_17195 [Henriciella sp.]|uniref:hypothetical protein n=1 Tax=Henriciella sp. TaxID=1968823 RepID=UPI003C731F3C
MRVVQPQGTRGSLKWLQIAIERGGAMLCPDAFPSIRWVSPLKGDDYAEYRDAAFLDVIGQGHLKEALGSFWPKRGPQWDALGLAGDRAVLVEAKAHLDEFFSPPTQASEKSLSMIGTALSGTAARLQARTGTDWTKVFFQYANRIAHLDFLRQHRVDAHLLFVSFIGDEDMGGPTSRDEWRAAFRTADYALGLRRRHALSPYIHHVWPDVSKLA